MAVRVAAAGMAAACVVAAPVLAADPGHAVPATPAVTPAVTVPLAPTPAATTALPTSLAIGSAVPVTLRAGDHPGFGRLVLDVPANAHPMMSRADGRVMVTVAGMAFGPLPRLPRNAAAMQVSGDALLLEVPPGVVARSALLPGRFLLDLMDPDAAAVPAFEPGASEAAAAASSPVTASTGPAAALRKAVVVLPVAAATVTALPSLTIPAAGAATMPAPRHHSLRRVASPLSASRVLPVAPGVSSGRLGTSLLPGFEGSGQAAPSLTMAATPDPGQRRGSTHPQAAPATSPGPPPGSTDAAASAGAGGETRPPEIGHAGSSAVAVTSAPGTLQLAPTAAAPVGTAPAGSEPAAGGAAAMPPVSQSALPAPDAAAPGLTPSADASPGSVTDMPVSPSSVAGSAVAATGLLPASAIERRIALPVPSDVGAAALRRGNRLLLVVDANSPTDANLWTTLPGLEDASVTSLPEAVVVSVPIPQSTEAALNWSDAGWVLVLGVGPKAEALSLSSEPAHLLLAASGASRVVSIPDPLGGGILLVGTQAGDSTAQRVPATWHLPPLTLLSTLRGAAVEPLSDAIDMRPTAAGFVIDPGPQLAAIGPLPQGAAAAAASASASRRFDLPDLPADALRNRLQVASNTVAEVPPRQRGTAEIQAAEAMLALGLGAEAGAMLQLAVADDARLAGRRDVLALGAVAGVLAGRMEDTAGLDDPSVQSDPSSIDEMALWRAIRAASLASSQGVEPPRSAARVLAQEQALLLAYPAPLRERLLPLAAETMAEGGEVAAAEKLVLAGKDQPGLDYARALLDARTGRIDSALKRLDQLAGSRDRREHARAAVRAVELRLTAGQLTPAKAADALDALVAAWRGDDRELAVRLRVVELRTQAGQPRAALALLRETADPSLAVDWSEPRRAEVQARLVDTFRQMLAQDEKAPLEPLEFVSMVEENAGLLPPGPEGQQLALRLADRLAALDLPERAEAALRKLVDSIPLGVTRAQLGERLATLQQQHGDALPALMSLSASTADKLPPELVAERTLTFARASAARGDLGPATETLAALGTPPALALRAELFEHAGKWPQATTALIQVVANEVSPSGVLTPAQAALVLRLASAAAQAGQEAVLDRIRTDLLPRVAPGHDADTLRVLTQGPVQSLSDLPRAAQEATLARSIVR